MLFNQLNFNFYYFYIKIFIKIIKKIFSIVNIIFKGLIKSIINIMPKVKLTGATFNTNVTATCHYSNGTHLTVPSSCPGYSSGHANCPPSN